MLTKIYRSFIAAGIILLLISVPFVLADKGGNGNGNGNKPTKKIIKLQPTAVEPGATGIAKIMLKTKGNAMQRFQVVGANLKDGTMYSLVVDNVELAKDTAAKEAGDNESAVEFQFAKKAKGSLGTDQLPLPASIDPVTVIKHVEIRDGNGMAVLTGDFPQ